MSKKSDIVKNILNHPDFSEIIAKLSIGGNDNENISDISQWLDCKYESVDERKFHISEKSLKMFFEEYYDFYNIIREDAVKVSNPSTEIKMELALSNDITYQNALKKYANDEVDIRLTAKRIVAAIETRAAQVFDMCQEDVRNLRNEKILVEWMNLLFSVCEKFESIQNGTSGSQINIQNNINIQSVDKHINLISNLITKIIAELDIEKSMKFMDMFNTEMSNLRLEDSTPLPIDVRLNEAKALEIATNQKLSQ